MSLVAFAGLFVCLFVCNSSCANSELVAPENSAKIPTVWSPSGKGRRSLMPGTTISSLFGFPFWFEISDSEYDHESFVFLSWKTSTKTRRKFSPGFYGSRVLLLLHIYLVALFICLLRTRLRVDRPFFPSAFYFHN